MTTSIPAAKDQSALNPNVVLGVLLTAVLAASIMGFFHLSNKIDTRIGEVRTEIREVNTKLDRLTELLLSGKIKVTAP